MNGLEDQAEAAVKNVIDQLYTNDIVNVKHSSRDVVLIGVCSAFKSDNRKSIVAKKLVLRSGVSTNGLRLLEEALQFDNMGNTIEELEFVCLQDTVTLQRVMQLCRRSGIKRLSLKNFATRMLRQNRDLVSETIRSGLILESCEDHEEDVPADSPPGGVMLQSLEIVNYPIGSEGAAILAEALRQNSTLKILKLIDCDLRSDSATHIAQIIRENQNLKELDLSYNRHYLGSPLTREMTVKNLVQRGLKHNLSLLELHMREPTRDKIIDRSKIDQQLDINRFRNDFVVSRRDPMDIYPFALWSHLLARVSSKPSALYLFLQDSVPTLFAR